MDNPDMQLGVEFFVKAIENPNKTREAGRPIFDDVEMVRIGFPADNKRVLVAPAHEMHYVPHAKQQMTYAQRFAASYAAFKDENEDFVNGTPLTEAPFLTNALREELKTQKVKTVEQLAGLPDVAIRRLGVGWRERVEQAQAFLKTADSVSEIAALRAELAALKAEKAPPAPAPIIDQFAGFDDEDLKNMIRDAGGDVPRGNASRAKLIERLQEIAAQKEEA
jgi:hypothetical protein